jgi:hypothetical protein
MNQQPRLCRTRDYPVYRWCSPKPTIPCVYLERGLSLLASQLIKRPPISSPRSNRPLSKHSNNVWLRWSRRASPRRKWRPRPGRWRQRGGSSSTADARAFLRWARTHTTFRAHRQHAGLECRHLRHGRPWRWWSSGRAARDRSDDDDAGKQYCRCHPLPPSYFFILLLLPYLVPWWCCCESVCDWWTLANDKFSSSQTPDARLRAAIATPPKFRSPGLHLELLRDPSFKTRIHFYLWPFLVLAHVPLQSPDLSRFQCCIHPDRVSRLVLVLVPLLYFAEPTLSPS